jgi:NodT family efflux transporter outer membrane factor (OMF) lipoprotein
MHCPTPSTAGIVPRSALLLTLLALGGCATVATVPSEPAFEVPPAFSSAGEQPRAAQWWRELDDPVLHALIEQALRDSFSLRSAQARLVQAQAAARRDGAALAPSVNLEANQSARRNQDGRLEPSGSDAFSLALGAGYEVDLWGRLGAAADAARLDGEVSAQELEAAAITLSGEIGRIWYRLSEQREQLALLQAQLEANEQVLELVNFRFRQGRAASADVLRQRQAVEAVRGQHAQVRAGAGVLQHQLAVLVGQPPQGFDVARGGLIALPPLPATGVPAELLQQRPDVQQAYFALAAADRRVAAAVAARYPRLSLSASVSTTGADLFQSWLATLAANLLQPLIDGGARAAEVERTRALTEQRLFDYQQVMLTALREVEDALVNEQQQQQYIASLERQLEQSDTIVDNLRARYLQGQVNYLDVLDALLTRQSLQRERLAAHRQLTEYRIDLYRALAGGLGAGAALTTVLGTDA